ncbi:MAG: hypothetical protein M1536_08030 [Firmicutes bacterium]|nr:hypothetical protein [Bacillota bacterium]
MEKAFLDEKRVKYENISVDQDEKGLQEMFSLSGQMGVPFTVITKDDGTLEKILGFDKAKLTQALGLQ